MALTRAVRSLALLLIVLAVGRLDPAPQSAADLDHDGIPDALEQELAERFAPIVYHSADEPNLPTNVPLFLPATGLRFYDPACTPSDREVAAHVGPVIPRLRIDPCRAGDGPVDSWNTRSAAKLRTFYLPDVPPEARPGSRNSGQWITYFHAYRNSSGGITLQYWRFYAYNTSEFWGHRAAVGNHGGDWEAVHLVLGPGPGYAPIEIVLLGHRDITRKPFASASVSGSHILVSSGKGGHTTELIPRQQPPDPHRTIRHESWTGGSVRWPDGSTSRGGALVNLGEKTAPMPGMEFLRYSGLWGTRQSKGWFATLNSGYWGPAYNETGMAKDGFITAWCVGMADAQRSISDASADKIRECYAGR